MTSLSILAGRTLHITVILKCMMNPVCRFLFILFDMLFHVEICIDLIIDMKNIANFIFLEF